MLASRFKCQSPEEKATNYFDQTKLSIFVNPKTGYSEESSVEKEKREESLDMKDNRGTSRGLPGLWQEPIEEENEEDQEYSKLKQLEKRKKDQQSMVTPQKPGKLKLNFSLWEKNDGVSSKRAVKRIFMNKTNLQKTADTLSSKKFGNQGNTTLDSSDQNTTEKPGDENTCRKLSLMTDFSHSGGSEH